MLPLYNASEAKDYFAEFSKRVQGLLARSRFKSNTSETSAFVSGALLLPRLSVQDTISLEVGSETVRFRVTEARSGKGG